MPRFSDRSRAILETCHPDLQRVFNEVVKHVDCTVLVGARGKIDQEKAFSEGRTKLHWPKSKHNKDPYRNPNYSLAVDVAPYPINWADTARFYYFAGFVLGVASQMGIKLRFGGDWDKDFQLNDNRFDDLDHFELVEE